jgi:hypothetical protein
MGLSDHQYEFLKDIAKLIQFAEEKGIKLTAGEAYRTADQQLLYYHGKDIKEAGSQTLVFTEGRKRSWTKYSNHMRRLAMDFNFFVDGALTYDKSVLSELGEYWEGLSPLNRWGGNFSHTDTPHFERNV